MLLAVTRTAFVTTRALKPVAAVQSRGLCRLMLRTDNSPSTPAPSSAADQETLDAVMKSMKPPPRADIDEKFSSCDEAALSELRRQKDELAAQAEMQGFVDAMGADNEVDPVTGEFIVPKRRFFKREPKPVKAEA